MDVHLSATFDPTLIAGIAIMAGVFAWVIHIHGRVNRSVAPLLDRVRHHWDVWNAAIVLEGTWDGVPVRIRSEYTRWPRLSVTMGVVTRPPDMGASLDRSGDLLFRSIPRGQLGTRISPRAGQSELGTLGGTKADIAAYFTPARVQCLRTLFDELKWGRFVKDRRGLTVSKSGPKPQRWKPHEARQVVLATLVQLRILGSGT